MSYIDRKIGMLKIKKSSRQLGMLSCTESTRKQKNCMTSGLILALRAFFLCIFLCRKELLAIAASHCSRAYEEYKSHSSASAVKSKENVHKSAMPSVSQCYFNVNSCVERITSNIMRVEWSNANRLGYIRCIDILTVASERLLCEESLLLADPINLAQEIESQFINVEIEAMSFNRKFLMGKDILLFERDFYAHLDRYIRKIHKEVIRRFVLKDGVLSISSIAAIFGLILDNIEKKAQKREFYAKTEENLMILSRPNTLVFYYRDSVEQTQ